MTRTYGHARKGTVPNPEGTEPRVCGKCDKWFAARARERVCDGCVPASVRTKRACGSPYTGTGGISGKAAGQKGGKSGVQGGYLTVRSETLGVTFRCPANSPVAARMLCIVLAYALAAKIDRGKSQPRA